ncbi:MAG TPA: polyprenyl synthetase family protein [Deltaproteobacteria bacterium]|nr:polyprenyl synthetase family protein [Deltaproteobacteria bacterium]HQI00012.1 polyprenyl synthetase family protein [Deltaproteobacteria bacterium]HQJ09237.1 polyprenyl synthetase family protein [Deltaproteobacteria bacterium]
MDIVRLTAGKKKIFEDFLRSYLARADSGSGIFEAFSYSLTAGGKRLRPILTMLACECMGGKESDALPAGLAIEMIHTFSLIHDDLPALDNDDLRRGRPTCHAKFGEATAILAGDALIFQALSVINSSPYQEDVKLDILKCISDVCGVEGLVQGEYRDVVAEGKDLSLDEIEDIYRKKTSRLFELCMYAGARVASADAEKIGRLVRYGTYLGLAFQAIDDILDMTSSEEILGKSSGKDLVQGKATVVKALGLDGARLWAGEMTSRAVSSIDHPDNGASSSLKEIARWMLKRVM